MAQDDVAARAVMGCRPPDRRVLRLCGLLTMMLGLFTGGTAQAKPSTVAVMPFRDLAADSVYRQVAKEEYDKMFPLFVSNHLQKADAARRSGDPQG